MCRSREFEAPRGRWQGSLVGMFLLAAVACRDGDRGPEPSPSPSAGPAAAHSGRDEADHDHHGQAKPGAQRDAAPGRGDDWCVEHAVPESMCTKCDPGLVARFQAAGDFCAEHRFPESVCPLCNPVAPPAGAEEAAIEARIVRFRSAGIEAAAGLRAVAARRASRSSWVECPARIAFDADRVAEVRAIVPGIVRDIRVELGDQVRRGAPLFELESTRVGELQASLRGARERVRTAQVNLDRQRELKELEVGMARQVELAEQELASAQSEVQAAEATLRLAGAAAAAPSGRYTLRAPIDGTVLRRPALVGLLATDTTSLATLGDTSIMWALCDVAEADASRVALGQAMHVVLNAGDDAAELEGKITWIAAEVDPRTRTVSVRGELGNPDGQLRANQFARARIETGGPRAAVSVPRDAIQRVGRREVVFVRTAAGVYEPRVVRRLGGGELVPIEGRVKEGDPVVTTGAVLLRTEVLPGSIGAGCCDVGPPGEPAQGH